MTQKVLLAEALNILQQCEVKEYDLDKTREKVCSNNRYRKELGRLYQGYSNVYSEFLRGVSILNHVRYQVLDDPAPRDAHYNRNLVQFCEGKMSAYMDRCENITRKMDAIFLPLDQIDGITKPGFTDGDTDFLHSGTTNPLTRGNSVIEKELPLNDGTYVFTVKNKDNYTLAAPDVDVLLRVIPERSLKLDDMVVTKSVPAESCWRKVIGVVASATLQMRVSASGVRDAHVDITVQRLVPVSQQGDGDGARAVEDPSASPLDGEGIYSSNFDDLKKSSQPSMAGGSQFSYGPDTTYAPAQSPPTVTTDPVGLQTWTAGLAAIPDSDVAALASYNVPTTQLPTHHSGGGGGGGVPQEDATAALQSLHVPRGSRRPAPSGGRLPDPVVVNPKNKTCKERLYITREMLKAWPDVGVPERNLPLDKQRIILMVEQLPLPTSLS